MPSAVKYDLYLVWPYGGVWYITIHLQCNGTGVATPRYNTMPLPLKNLESAVQPWGDTLDDGSLFFRNTHTNICGSNAIPESLSNMPFGYGASVFDLGPQAEFVRGLLGQDTGSQLVADAIAAALPVDCPRSVKVQLCTQEHAERPSLDSGPEFANCVLLVWGHHAPSAAALKAQLETSIKTATVCATDGGGDEATHADGGVGYTIGEAVQDINQLKSECNNQSRGFRRQVAGEVLDVLTERFMMVISDEKAGIGCRYDTLNFDQVHVIPEQDGTVSCLCDYNVGPDALVFHSPARGCTLFSHEVPSCQVVLPGSDGRIVTAADPTVSIPETPGKMPTSSAAIAIQCLSNTNNFTSIDGAEGSYLSQLATLYASNAIGCNAHRLRAIATAFPPVQRQNGKLDGIRACETLSALLGSLSSSCTQIVVPNTDTWRQELTNADPRKRPYLYMNAETALVGDDGTTTYFVVDVSNFDREQV